MPNSILKMCPSKQTFVLLALCLFGAATLTAQTLTTLYSVCPQKGCPNGYYFTGLVQATNGDLYGTTNGGGDYDAGFVFKITTSGALTILNSFCANGLCPFQQPPFSALVEDSNGNLYGASGPNSHGDGGTLFKISLSGTPTTLYSFACDGYGACLSGSNPTGALVEATNGDLYGTTARGGEVIRALGTVFKITPGGVLTTLYGFCAQLSPEGVCIDGENPFSGLVQAKNGDLYGTTTQGGSRGDRGIIFKITPEGAFTTVYNFCSKPKCADGHQPYAPLIQATDGDLYGTTRGEGAGNGYGTIFKITPGGKLTTLYTFCAQRGCTDGWQPLSGVIQATDGNFYGITQRGGTSDAGTIYRIAPSGTLTTLHSFCSEAECADGATPLGGLIQATDGNLYGATGEIMTKDYTQYATIFRLSLGLSPFVKTLPTSARVGASVKIYGTDLSGVIGVSFNGLAAAFTVVSKSEVSATVPEGATSGTVSVITSSGTLTSNVPLVIRP